MIPTYCVHYDKLVDRKQYVLSTQVGNCTFITGQYDNVEDYKFYNPDPKLWAERCEGLYKEIPPFRELRIGDLACASKHLEALVIGRLNHPKFMVVEDDIIQERDLSIPLRGLNFFQDEWDVAIIGGAFSHEIAKTKETLMPNILIKDHPATNTVCAYIIKDLKARELFSSIYENKLVLPIDFEYNYWFKQLNFRVAHYVPYVFREGSSAGYYKGTQAR